VTRTINHDLTTSSTRYETHTSDKTVMLHRQQTSPLTCHLAKPPLTPTKKQLCCAGKSKCRSHTMKFALESRDTSRLHQRISFEIHHVKLEKHPLTPDPHTSSGMIRTV
jgi:hypothetical protein